MIRPVALCLLTTCIAWQSGALAAENDPGVWVTFTTTDTIGTDEGSGRWHYWFDAQARYFDIGSGINQWLVRPGIGYRLSDELKVWAGYARVRSRNRAGDVADENRYWQQLDWNAGRWFRGTIALRARLEQRSLNVGEDLGLVLRLGARYVHPVGRKRKSSLVLGLEPFLALRSTDWGGKSGLTQNRIFVLMGRRLTDNLSVAAGYMNQYFWVDDDVNRSNHLGVINFRMKL